jgi:hypothetical protein
MWFLGVIHDLERASTSRALQLRLPPNAMWQPPGIRVQAAGRDIPALTEWFQKNVPAAHLPITVFVAIPYRKENSFRIREFKISGTRVEEIVDQDEGSWSSRLWKAIDAGELVVTGFPTMGQSAWDPAQVIVMSVEEPDVEAISEWVKRTMKPTDPAQVFDFSIPDKEARLGNPDSNVVQSRQLRISATEIRPLDASDPQSHDYSDTEWKQRFHRAVQAKEILVSGSPILGGGARKFFKLIDVVESDIPRVTDWMQKNPPKRNFPIHLNVTISLPPPPKEYQDLAPTTRNKTLQIDAKDVREAGDENTIGVRFRKALEARQLEVIGWPWVASEGAGNLQVMDIFEEDIPTVSEWLRKNLRASELPGTVKMMVPLRQTMGTMKTYRVQSITLGAPGATETPSR